MSVHVNLGSDTKADSWPTSRPSPTPPTGGISPLVRRWCTREDYASATPAIRLLVARAVCVATDLGADIVKTIYPGSPEDLADIVRASSIPVLVAGDRPGPTPPTSSNGSATSARWRRRGRWAAASSAPPSQEH